MPATLTVMVTSLPTLAYKPWVTARAAPGTVTSSRASIAPTPGAAALRTRRSKFRIIALVLRFPRGCASYRVLRRRSHHGTRTTRASMPRKPQELVEALGSQSGFVQRVTQ
jgi:hypothetical protein